MAVTRERVGILLAMLLFVSLAGYQLTLPGLHYDEAFELIPSMRIIHGERAETFRQNGIAIGEQLFPLMTQDYIGAINTYAAVPFLAALGIRVSSLRIMGIVIGLFTILLTYHLARRLAGPLAAGVSSLLLAASPSFVFWSRQGVFVTSVTATIGVAAALSWLRWWETRRQHWALMGAFLLGVGLYAKFLSLWLLAALGISALVVILVSHYRRGGKWQQEVQFILTSRGIGLGLVTMCAALFTLGVSPLIVYNIQTGGTFHSLGANLTTSYYGTNNLAFFPNLWERIGQVGTVLSGDQLWYLGATYANYPAVVLFLVSCLAMGVSLFTQGADSSNRRALVPFLVVLFTVLSSCATVSALWITHFAILLPWLFIAVGAGVEQTVRVLNTNPGRIRTTFVPGILVLTAVVGLIEVTESVRYHLALTATGGLGDHSDAVYDMADFLQSAVGEEDGTAPVVAMDWGLAASAAFLTGGRVNPIEAFGYEWETDEDFTSRLAKFVHNPDSIYLWRAPDGIIFDRSREFQAIYRPLGKQEEILAAFYDRTGKPVYGATMLVPSGTAINPPQPID